jgi:DNA invertase Pin-like site-specific DNA recombinase
MFQMLGVFAEFERSIIQERVRAGLQRASSLAALHWPAAIPSSMAKLSRR